MRDEVKFNGLVYRRYPNGKHPNYFYNKKGRKRVVRILHRDIYEFYKGPIPDGYVIHHVDGNPLNNSIENLLCVTPSEHSRIHRQFEIHKDAVDRARAENGYTKENWKERRKKSMATAQARRGICKECGKPFTVTNVHQKFCNPNCRKRSNTRDSIAELTCEVCGKKFMAPTYDRRKTCSSECAHKITALARRKRGL